MESLTPNLFVRNIDLSINFYKKLGFELIMTVPEKGNFDWAMMKCGDVTIMLQTVSSLKDELPQITRQPGGSLLFYINIKNIRQFFDKIKDTATIVKGLEKAFYGPTEFSITDIDGYVLTFAEDEQ